MQIFKICTRRNTMFYLDHRKKGSRMRKENLFILQQGHDFSKNEHTRISEEHFVWKMLKIAGIASSTVA